MTKDYVAVFVIIPVKRLDNAKSRLSSILTDDERKHFCLKMLEDVLETVNFTKHPHETVVISKDPTVSKIAKNFEVAYLKERKTGLNKAVSEAVDWCVEMGAASVLVLPADIPSVMPTELERIFTLGEKASMVISSSRNGKGTNALLLTPPNVSPTFYGPHSFQRHIKEAKKLKISCRRYRSPGLALDIDTIEDLTYFVSLRAKETYAYKLLEKIEVANKLDIHQRRRKD
jgi:2-phospho-L-lactate guanylyltransferase